MLYHRMDAHPLGSWLTLEITTSGREVVCKGTERRQSLEMQALPYTQHLLKAAGITAGSALKSQLCALLLAVYFFFNNILLKSPCFIKIINTGYFNLVFRL